MNEELFQIFFSEAEELIEAMESGLLALEKNPDDADRINEVFRAAHTMKGNAATVGLDRLVDFAHIQENALDMIRKGKLSLTAETTSLLLASVDSVRNIVNASLSGEPPDEERLLDLENKIRDLDKPNEQLTASRSVFDDVGSDEALEEIGPIGKTASLFAGVPSLPRAAFEIDRQTLEDALLSDKHLFVLWVRDDDLNEQQADLGEFADKISMYGDPLEILRMDDYNIILLASVLEEPEMAALAAEIDEDQVFHFNQDKLQEAMDEAAGAHPADNKEPPSPYPPEQGAAPEEPEKKAENRNQPLSPGSETIRVGVDLIDRLMNLAGELVLGRNQLRRRLAEEAESIKGLAAVLQHLNQVTTDIQEHTIQMRMQPVGNVLNKLPRLVRDISRQENKEVDLIIEGADVELDKSIVQAMLSPLIETVDYCLKQGLESPDERLTADKPQEGKIVVRAFHEEGLINITLTDDGRGLDPDQIVRLAAARGLLDQGRIAGMSEKEKLNLVFTPGFATASIETGARESSDLARVRSEIEQVGGNLEIESAKGLGTTFSFRLPLTLAIIPCLIVRARDQHFAIPQRDVLEMVSINSGNSAQRIETIGGSTVMRRRGELLPLASLDVILELSPDAAQPSSRVDISNLSNEIFVIVLRLGANRYGLIVDELLDVEEIVVKPLSRHIKDCRFFSGATIMGDGAAAMILNAAGLADEAGFSFSEVEAENKKRQAREKQKQVHDPSKAFIIFNNAPDEFFALPLSGISRLETASCEGVQKIGKQEYINYRGGSLPLLRIDNILPVKPFEATGDTFYLIIPRTNGPAVGIAASRIVDAYNVDVDVKPTRSQTPGVMGRAMINGRLTMFLNAEELLAAC